MGLNSFSIWNLITFHKITLTLEKVKFVRLPLCTDHLVSYRRCIYPCINKRVALRMISFNGFSHFSGGTQNFSATWPSSVYTTAISVHPAPWIRDSIPAVLHIDEGRTAQNVLCILPERNDWVKSLKDVILCLYFH